MRAMSLPRFGVKAVYETCIDSVGNPEKRARFQYIIEQIIDAETVYITQAGFGKLAKIQANNCSNDDIVFGDVTKEDLKALYTDHFVPKTKPARQFYEKLLSAAGMCPFCGFGQASNLDHFLPKAKYPKLSVVPANLVPSCRDCNTSKGVSIHEALHPYFDHGICKSQWLYAKICSDGGATVTFFVQPPTNSDDAAKAKIISHFTHFNLADRYSTQACNELGALRGELRHFDNALTLGVEVEKHLTKRAHSYLHMNSWQSALYRALANSSWFCEGGFNVC